MAKIAAHDLRPGMLIEYNKALWRVINSTHVHVSGRGGACVQTELRGVEDSSKLNQRFRTDEKIARPFVDNRQMQYLYAESDSHIFMDSNTFEQITLPGALLEGLIGYLLSDMQVTVTEINGRAVGVDLPTQVTLTVVTTEPHIKGATATGSFKPAQTNTGMTVMVPPFIKQGETIAVSTATGEYLERAT